MSKTTAQSRKREARASTTNPIERFSERSQASMIEEYRKKQQLARLQASIAVSERKARKFDEQATQYARVAAVQGPILRNSLADTLVNLESEKRLLAAYKEEAARLEAQVNELAHPAPSDLAARRQNQTLLRVLAQERLEVDRRLGSTLEGVKALLFERRTLSKKMGDIASFINLSVGHDGFDIGRFEALRDALPERMTENSEAWIAWFLGETLQTTTEYTVTDETLTLPETLASPNFFRRGERVELTVDQAERAFPKYSAPPSMETDASQKAELEAWERSLSR